MAADYLHRLVVAGNAERLRRLTRALYREYPRTVAGQTWTEVAPFSFAALYELAPSAARIESEVPHDPYELAAWPVRVLANGRAEARYQFQTRSLEVAPFVRALARAHPRLAFTLVTLCLDDLSIESHSFSRGRARKWVLSAKRGDFHWEQARNRYNLHGDAVYDDDDAEDWVREQMLAEALVHWRPSGDRRWRRYRWWNRPRLRDLQTERELAWYAAAELMAAQEREQRTRRAIGKRQSRRTS